MGAGVEPGKAALEIFHIKLAFFKIEAVEIGDLQFAARRRLQPGCQFHHLVVVKIQAGDGMVRFWLDGFLLQPDRPPVLVELDDAILLGMIDPVGKHRRPNLAGHGILQKRTQARTEKNIVA